MDAPDLAESYFPSVVLDICLKVFVLLVTITAINKNQNHDKIIIFKSAVNLLHHHFIDLS